MFKLKKILSFTFLFLVLLLLSCKNKQKTNLDKYNFNEETKEETSVDPFDFDENYGDKKIAVVYFSVTSNTKTVAEKFKNVLDADIIEIIPKEPYTNEDISGSEDSRCNKEHELIDLEYFLDETLLDSEENDLGKIEIPEYKNINIRKYNVIILGFPIWYGEAPRLIYKFIKDENLDNKIIIPFCTSAGSDIDVVEQQLSVINENAIFMQGRRFDKDATEEEIKNYLINIGTDLGT